MELAAKEALTLNSAPPGDILRMIYPGRRKDGKRSME
jgi:hypothetical protein